MKAFRPQGCRRILYPQPRTLKNEGFPPSRPSPNPLIVFFLSDLSLPLPHPKPCKTGTSSFSSSSHSPQNLPKTYEYLTKPHTLLKTYQKPSKTYQKPTKTSPTQNLQKKRFATLKAAKTLKNEGCPTSRPSPNPRTVYILYFFGLGSVQELAS